MSSSEPWDTDTNIGSADPSQYAYYLDPKSVEQYIGMAEGFNGLELIQELESFRRPGSSWTILELGSGPGSDWELLSALKKGETVVVGSDVSPVFVDRLKEKYPKGQFLVVDAVTLALPPQQCLDVIYSNKVLHHLTNAQLSSCFRRQNEILQDEDGLVCHSFWKGEGIEDMDGIMFSNYHTEESLKALMKPYFEVLQIKSYKEMEDGDSILIVGRKKKKED
jgi:SAM-dependent methyltransferase